MNEHIQEKLKSSCKKLDINLAEKPLFRVLSDRDKTRIDQGIFPKDSISENSAFKHVAWGSLKNQKSPFISTCADLDAMSSYIVNHSKKLCDKDMNFSMKIAVINRQKLLQEKILNLADENTRESIVETELSNAQNQKEKDKVNKFKTRFLNYGKRFKEVLYNGTIPTNAYKVINLSISLAVEASLDREVDELTLGLGNLQLEPVAVASP